MRLRRAARNQSNADGHDKLCGRWVRGGIVDTYFLIRHLGIPSCGTDGNEQVYPGH